MPLESGRALGPYEIRDRIGVGGMGEVYHAFDTRLRRSVAVKIVRDAGTSAADRARLEREAQAVAALSHPNIVSVFDVGNEDGLFYIVTELLQGHTLREELNRGRIATGTAIEFAREAALALHSAHVRGIVHRDIKPDNLFITSDAGLKVLDFGLAQLVATPDRTTAAHSPRLTAEDVVVGTAGYMSPEQLRGEAVGPGSDIFSLGCVLYEMLTGRAPFLRNTRAATFAAILNDVPSYADVPPAVVPILHRCMAKQPAARYESAGTLANDLARPPRTNKTSVALPAAAVIIAIAAIALFATRRHEDRRLAAAPAPPARRAMLAVLPFENLGGDPSQEYFSDGLTEEATTEFARISPEQLGVIARTSTMRYKGAHGDARTIGRELGVDYLVSGSVRRSGERVRVAAQLVRAGDGTEVWAESYDRTLNDVLTLESELARDVARAVQIKVMPQRVALQKRAGPQTATGRDLLLRARYHLTLGTTDDNKKAVALLQQALDGEPDSPLLMTELASALVNMSTRDAAPTEVMPRARALVERALQLDGSLAEAHAILADILLEYYWEWQQAEREVKTAIALDPNLADAYTTYATLLVCSGRTAEGRQYAVRGRALDPLGALQRIDSLYQLYCARQWNVMTNEARQAIELEPRFGFAFIIMALAQLESGDRAAALASADHAMSLSESRFLMSLVAYVDAKAGRPAEARTLVHTLESLSRNEFVCFFNVAAVYAALGEKEKAFASLERGYNDHTG